MSPTRMLRVLALLVVLVLIAAACGDDDDSATSSDPGTGASDTATGAGTGSDGDDEDSATSSDTGAGADTGPEAEGDPASSAGEDASEDTQAAEEEPVRDGFGVDAIQVMSRFQTGEDTRVAFDEAAAAFTAATGVEVEHIGEGGENLDVAYEAALLGGKEPHLVVINLFDRTTGWLDQGATVDVAPYIDAWGLRDVVDGDAIGEWTTESGAVQGFPYSGFAWPFWFNTSLLSEASFDGIPTTTDELIAAANALRANGSQPVVVGGSDWSGQKLFMQIAQMYTGPDGIRPLLQGGGFCADSDAMRGIQLFSDLLDAGVFIDDVEGYTADLMNETFYTGGAAMMPAGSWAFNGTPDDLIGDVQVGGFPLPSGSAFSNPTVYQGFTGVGFMISERAETEAIDALEVLIATLYEEEYYGRFAAGSNIVPAVQLEDLSGFTNPLFQAAIGSDYNDSTDVALLMDVWVPAASNDGVNQAIALAYAGGSPDDVCSGLDSAY